MFKALIVFYFSYVVVSQTFELPAARWARDVLDGWHGRWFPNAPGTEDTNPLVQYDPKLHTYVELDNKHMHMGIPSEMCDDAKTNLTLDWDNSPVNYTCFDNKLDYLPNYDVHPILRCVHIPAYYKAPHICMNSSIDYDEVVPTFGPHRLLWAKYGEYEFLPKQRWVHNLEHGAVVMLYHPCVNKNELFLLKNLVKGCLYRHIITPYNLLSSDRPLALLTWGCQFLMSKVDPKLVIDFIRHTALLGPEFLSRDGQFDYGLVNNAKIVFDQEDSNICPNL